MLIHLKRDKLGPYLSFSNFRFTKVNHMNRLNYKNFLKSENFYSLKTSFSNMTMWWLGLNQMLTFSKLNQDIWPFKPWTLEHRSFEPHLKTFDWTSHNLKRVQISMFIISQKNQNHFFLFLKSKFRVTLCCYSFLKVILYLTLRCIHPLSFSINLG